MSHGIQDAVAPIAVEIAQTIGIVLIIAISFLALLVIAKVNK